MLVGWSRKLNSYWVGRWLLDEVQMEGYFLQRECYRHHPGTTLVSHRCPYIRTELTPCSQSEPSIHPEHGDEPWQCPQFIKQKALYSKIVHLTSKLKVTCSKMTYLLTSRDRNLNVTTIFIADRSVFNPWLQVEYPSPRRPDLLICWFPHTTNPASVVKSSQRLQCDGL